EEKYDNGGGKVTKGRKKMKMSEVKKSMKVKAMWKKNDVEIREIIFVIFVTNKLESPEIDTYRSQFKSKFPNKDMKEEFPNWFGSQIYQRHVDKDPSVSTTSELFALAYGPTPTLISVNSCVVNGVRFVMHNRDERRTTQNSNICSPDGKGREIYYVAKDAEKRMMEGDKRGKASGVPLVKGVVIGFSEQLRALKGCLTF
nr:hypothetical protein [Tanacetum cinerariifolium]